MPVQRPVVHLVVALVPHAFLRFAAVHIYKAVAALVCVSQRIFPDGKCALLPERGMERGNPLPDILMLE